MSLKPIHSNSVVNQIVLSHERKDERIRSALINSCASLHLGSFLGCKETTRYYLRVVYQSNNRLTASDAVSVGNQVAVLKNLPFFLRVFIKVICLGGRCESK